ncbi:hypothetical protein [Bradyrhizobium roseum]|nr:hypothetical protein [Bradyrhizobium roseus]WKA28364.1 hypothetical protein QUH67_33325 [Bradyrhizobium roseus]
MFSEILLLVLRNDDVVALIELSAARTSSLTNMRQLEAMCLKIAGPK